MAQGNANSSARPSNYQVLIPQEYYANNTDDEISLKEIWDILIKRKFIIVGFLFIALFLAFVSIATTTPVYQVTAKMKLGLVQLVTSEQMRTVFVERPLDIVTTYNGKNGVGVSYQIPDTRRGMDIYVNLEISGVNPEEIKKTVENVLNEILHNHKVRYEEIKQQTEVTIHSVKTQLKMITLQLGEISKIKNSIKVDNRIHVLTEERNLQSRQVDLEKMLLELKFALREMTQTQVVNKPIIPIRPIKPKKRIIVVVSIILGLVAGIFAVFVMNFVAKIREAQN